jgi:putative transcriptional regulator
MKNNLKKIRQEKGLTQLDLSIRTKIQQSDISQVENEVKYAFPKWKGKFAEALGVSEADIFPVESISELLKEV